MYDMSNDWNIASSEPGLLDNNSYHLKIIIILFYSFTQVVYTLAPYEHKADIIFDYFF